MKIKFTNSLYMFSKFIMASSLSNLLGLFLFFVILYLSSSYSLALVSSYIVFILINFKLQSSFVFMKPDLAFTSKIGFFLVYFICFVFNFLFLSIFSFENNFHIFLMQFAYMVLNAFIIFPTLKRLIFF